MLEEICGDMRRCQANTQRVVQFVKFISSPQCEVVPDEIKDSTTEESKAFQRGCALLIEQAGEQSKRERSSVVMFKAGKGSSGPAGSAGARDSIDEATSNTSLGQSATTTPESRRDDATPEEGRQTSDDQL